MSTPSTPAPTAFNLNPDDATKRSLTDVYRVKESKYGLASDEYVARRDDGGRPTQWQLHWEALSFRFADNPNDNPIIQRSVNVTDKNGAPATWGDPTDPEPTKDDSFPIQLSKLFKKVGFNVGSDPSVLVGKVFLCERRKLLAGNTSIETLVPMQFLGDESFVYADDVRIVQGKESGQAGNPATGAVVQSGPTLDEAVKVFAANMVGKTSKDMITVALNDETTKTCGELLAVIAQPANGIVELEKYGSFAADGKYALSA